MPIMTARRRCGAITRIRSTEASSMKPCVMSRVTEMKATLVADLSSVVATNSVYCYGWSHSLKNCVSFSSS